ncbi:hypothetical protein HY310_00750 [Candidatus Microgenomates bacterium]|nr:hypothetical protein [Candidatus Microgenomates bacterium]
MNNLISPYDLGSLQLVERSEKVSVNDLLRQARSQFKKQFLIANIDILGTKIELTFSKTRFNGERIWFVCPMCNKRAGVLYRQPLVNLIGCRQCLNLRYKKQRYKGMIEAKV